MSRAIVGASLAVIPRAGHLSNLEAPLAFDDALAGFLAGLRLSLA
jgi:3-oxoadipate enol-lactonase